MHSAPLQAPLPPPGRMQADGAVPIMVGTTGHRDLRPEEVPRIAEAVSEVFVKLKRDYPASRIIMLSPLAEGADRLVAKVALQHGCRLIVPMPMPRSIYERDFESAESQAEFDSLVRQSIGTLQIPFPEGSAAVNSDRDSRYAAVGHWLADRAQVLIAIWDGVDNATRGGTASVVLHRLGSSLGESDHAWKTMVPQSLIHVSAGRMSTEPAASPGATKVLQPEEALSTGITLRRIDMFNREFTRYGKTDSLGEMTSQTASSTNPVRTLQASLTAFDYLATKLRKRIDFAWATLYLLGWLAVFCFELYTGPEPRSAIAGAYFGLIAVAWGIFVWAGSLRLQERQLDYRSIAEALRVQLFWRMTSISRDAADSYLVSQGSTLQWLRSAVSNLTTLADATRDNAPQELSSQSLNAVRGSWLKCQQSYFAAAARRDHRRLAARAYLSRALLAAGLLMFAYVAVCCSTPAPWLVVATAMAPVSAALIASHSDRLGLQEHVNQYSRMAQLFARAGEALDIATEHNDMNISKRILLELGKDCLNENAEWLLLHRQRPLSVPQG